MKKILFIAVCVIGVICSSSCKSTSSRCGLADTTTTFQKTLQEVDFS
ncbi:hypothetical protein OAJ14_02590 [Polaribacter sp.]|nr:hypothetical protein [Polaribacter sp.]